MKDILNLLLSSFRNTKLILRKFVVVGTRTLFCLLNMVLSGRTGNMTRSPF